jgi:protein ImuA
MHGVSGTSPKLEALREQIQKIEGLPRTSEDILPFGLADIDEALPWGGLPLACLHHVVGEDDALGACGFAPSAVTFVAALTARLKARRKECGTVLWCLPRYKAADTLYGPALNTLGLSEDALVLARAKDETEALWAMEEGLCCPDIDAVIGSLASPLSLAAERRLQLAAERGGTTGFLLQPGLAAASASAAVTRWRVGAAPSAPPLWPGLGQTRWTLTLDRCRQGTPHSWTVEWCDETCTFRLAAPLCDRSLDQFPGQASAHERTSALRAVA